MTAGERARGFSAEGRRQNLADLAQRRLDILVVGGGITGGGVAMEAVRRGYDVGLVDARDFASGTSSRSSKLVHGGIRYLGQGEVALVHEALQERRRLREMFPGLVRPMPFLMPIPRGRGQEAMLATGFWMYDGLSVGSGFPRHRRITAAEARHLAPALRSSDIRGAWKYWDAQTDDARLTIEVLRRGAAGGALMANYTAVRRAERREGWWHVDLEDVETGARLSATSRYLVNAGGVWAEEIGGLAGHQDAQIRPSKGVHLSFSAEVLPIQVALAFPVGDGRVLFAIPWLGYTIVGTTDGDYDGDIATPTCSDNEVAELLAGINRYFHLDLGPDAVLSRWAGVRPLVSHGGDEATKDLSRKPFITLGDDGLLTVTGGKLTTFVRMSVEALDLLPGGRPGSAPQDGVAVGRPDNRQNFQPGTAGEGSPLPGAAGYTTADVARACEEEMALHLDDVLARRLRLAFVDAAAALAAAPPAAEVMRERVGWGSAAPQVAAFAGSLARDFGFAPAAAAVG